MAAADGPLARSPYDILGVTATASDDDLRRAYRRKLRETHPDTGGAAQHFHAVQHAWELIGTPEARAAYDRGGRRSTGGSATQSGDDQRTWAPAPPPKRPDSRPQARAYGHPGGWFRERYLELLHEWVGRGVAVPDPYDVALLRSAPREVRHLLAAAVAEEDTARALSTLGIGFTVWHDVRTAVVGPDPRNDRGKIDHIVLGPTGLWAMLSEDWGEPVKTKRGELIGPTLRQGERPVHELSARARAFARAARVKFSALLIVVPDGASPEDVIPLGSVRGSQALLVQRPRLVDLVRTGLPGVGIGGTDLFEVRTRVASAVQFI